MTGQLVTGQLVTGQMLALLAALAMPVGQDVSLDHVPVKDRQYVIYSAEPQEIAAGRLATLELHFRVKDGFHVNSHRPNSELLLPTEVELTPGAGVKALPAYYPAGMPFSFSFDPTEKLDVYESDFVVKLPVTASKGAHEINGVLKYQACNQAACYPPKTLPIVVTFTAK